MKMSLIFDREIGKSPLRTAKVIERRVPKPAPRGGAMHNARPPKTLGTTDFQQVPSRNKAAGRQAG